MDYVGEETVLKYPTWKDIKKMSDALAYQISIGKEIDSIVGIIRGGLVPATIISHRLGLPLYTINHSSKLGNGDGREIDVIGGLNRKPFLGKHPLFIDDIADTGNTLADIKEVYSNAQTAVLYYNTNSVVKPDYWEVELPDDAPWIYFPWEMSS